METLAGVVLAIVGLVSALGAVGVVAVFDGGQVEHRTIYVPGLFLAALGGLAVVYSIRSWRGPLWSTAIVSVLYSFLIVFGAGFVPLIASLLLLSAVVSSSLAARRT